MTGKKTANPHNLAHTPSGSSSGSAAAVADYQVPLAIGTQTFGSIIRPGSFCGVYSFKPTWETVSINGCLGFSKTLDTIGFFARSVEDFQLLSDSIQLKDSLPPSKFNGIKGARLAWCKTPMWRKAKPETALNLEAAVKALRDHGASVEELVLSSDFDDAQSWHLSIATKELSVNMLSETVQNREDLDTQLLRFIEMGEAQSWDEYRRAIDGYAALRPKFDKLAKEYDAIITLSAPGEAPEGLQWTGDSCFCVMWTVSLPGREEKYERGLMYTS